MIFRSFLASPAYLVMLYFTYLATAPGPIPDLNGATDILAGYFAVSTLLGYNNYRGREGDALSPKAIRRPLAGLAKEHAGAELVVATTAFLTIILPTLRGNLTSVALFSAALWAYAVLFANRCATRPVALLKPLSATLGTSLLMAGMLWPSLEADPTIAVTVICTVLLTTAWRFAFELACDATDFEADLHRGEVTPATRWGLRPVLIAAPCVMLLCIFLIGLLQFAEQSERGPTIALSCFTSAAVLAAAIFVARRDSALRARLLVRFSTMFTFGAGLSLLLWNSGAQLAAIIWFVFLIGGADFTAVLKLLRSFPVKQNPNMDRYKSQ